MRRGYVKFDGCCIDTETAWARSVASTAISTYPIALLATDAVKPYLFETFLLLWTVLFCLGGGSTSFSSLLLNGGGYCARVVLCSGEILGGIVSLNRGISSRALPFARTLSLFSLWRLRTHIPFWPFSSRDTAIPPTSIGF
jgi:hypothetical protein